MNALIVSAILGVIMMFSGILFKSKATSRSIAIAGVVLLFILNAMEMYGVRLFNVDTTGMMKFDRFALLFNAIAFFCTFIFFILSSKDMEKVGSHYSDYFGLIFFILCGVVLSASFTSLLILFLGIEIISIPLYILTGSDKRNLKGNEAALKYFLMGSFSTGLMLMGIAMLYGATGGFTPEGLQFTGKAPGPLVIAGMLMMLFGMLFKGSGAPFHFWTPDVYDGAPTVFTSFMATIVKAAVFIAFIRLFEESFGTLHSQWQIWMALFTAATLFVGNITAVFQQSVKRMLAYSSISQAGFMLMAVYAINTDAKEGILLYAAAYSLATIAIFAVVAKMNDHSYEGFNGLAKHHPVTAATVAVCLLSLTGIPLTAGFLAKFYMLKAVISTDKHLWLAIFGVVMAAVSAFYYFRLIQAMYFRDGDQKGLVFTPRFRWSMIIVAVLIVLLGVFPNLLLNWFYF